MNTPIFDFLKQYVERDAVRFHMPGHKGNGLLGIEKTDITEIDGADILYDADGIIKQSEENAATLFETQKTIYSVEGSSLVIRAMLYLLKIYAGKACDKPMIAACRNVHKSFVNACGLLDFDIKWLYPEHCETFISCRLTAEFLDDFLKNCEKMPLAIYITAPDYLGEIPDIAAISAVCKKYGLLLLVDNAHGAYLKFLPKDKHPISLGADLCCDSAHKTLPALTGAAYFHISHNAPDFFAEYAQNAMSIFASTSPSYLILQSLDLTNKYLSTDYPKKLMEFVPKTEALKQELIENGYCLIGNEPSKLTLAPKSFGYRGDELAEHLSKHNIVCEFSDPDFVVMMMTPEIGADKFELLKKTLLELPKKNPVLEKAPGCFGEAKRKMSINEALFSSFEELETEKCLGRIAAQATVSCPPAIPIVICGEEIDAEAINAFKYYGIKKCCVVKQSKGERL